jgi:uncharacterized protein YkwD
MRPFARGVATTILVLFAIVGVVSLVGVDVGVSLDGGVPVETDGEQPTVAASEADATEQPDSADGEAFNRAAVREAFYQRLNEFRDGGDVSHDLVLHEAARAHSQDMARDGFFDHVSPEGSDYADRVREAGGQCTRGGENIAQTWWREPLSGTAGPTLLNSPADVAESLFADWRASPGHREVMELRAVSDVGLGLAITDEGRIFATMVVC